MESVKFIIWYGNTREEEKLLGTLRANHLIACEKVDGVHIFAKYGTDTLELKEILKRELR